MKRPSVYMSSPSRSPLPPPSPPAPSRSSQSTRSERLSKLILFNGWVIFRGVYVPQLPYPFICWWASRLLPCPGYYKQCCDELWGTHVSFRSGFLGVYAQEWDCTSVLSMNIQGWFPLGLSGLISLQSKGLSRVFSSTTVWKHQFFIAQPSLWSNSHIFTWLLEKP